MTEMIPLNKLLLSEENVRKTDADEDIESLADSIHSKGLLQNLVVSKAPDAKGKYAVDAGGRRFLALRHNVALKRIPANHPVPCSIIAAEHATEASLAENLHRVAMNPADEVEAFATIVDRYADSGVTDRCEQVANCARRFGKTERYVEQRLRLANLAPDILEALREARITLAAAKAYASHPDHEVQLKVFYAEEKRGANYMHVHEPRSISAALAGKVYHREHRLVRYIGMDAYTAAGGRTEMDLFFDEEDREILVDPTIVVKLAQDKLELEAQKAAQADGWLDAKVIPVNSEYWNTPKIPEGYALEWHGAADLDTAARAECLSIYRVSDDGDGIEPIDKYFTRKIEAESPEATEPPETWEERSRRRQIRTIAARMAAPKLAGTMLEGRAFWPEDNYNALVETQGADGSTEQFVTLLIKVDASEVERHLSEAEAEYDAEQAKKERAEANEPDQADAA